MKKTLTLLLLWTLLAPLVAAQKDGRPDQLRDLILRLEREWANALTHADAAALERIYAPTLTYTHSSGAVDTKESYITNLKAGKPKYESVESEDVKVSSYGEHTAVVTSKATVKLTSNGTTSVLVMRLLHVYVKQPAAAGQPSRWQMVAHQTTRLAQ